MGIFPRLFGPRAKPSRHTEADRLLKEQLASLRTAVEQQERDMKATLKHVEHIFKPDNFVSAKFENGVLTVTHRH